MKRIEEWYREDMASGTFLQELSELSPTTSATAELLSAVADLSPPSIAVSDLQLVVRIIDVASSRGAFRGEELSAVGALRDKVFNVLKAVAPESVQPPVKEAEGEPEAEKK